MNDWRKAGCFFHIQIRALKDKYWMITAINNGLLVHWWKRDEFCVLLVGVQFVLRGNDKIGLGWMVLLHAMVHQSLQLSVNGGMLFWFGWTVAAFYWIGIVWTIYSCRIQSDYFTRKKGDIWTRTRKVYGKHASVTNLKFITKFSTTKRNGLSVTFC